MAKRYSFGLVSWKGAYGKTYVPYEPKKVDTTFAKKDTHVRRWFNKNHTDDTDLIGVLTFCLRCGFPPKAIRDFVNGVVPPSGWMESPQHPIGVMKRRRQRHEYSPDMRDLMSGYWKKWEEE